MTIYSDSTGNYYLGNSLYGNHAVGYGSYFKGHPHSSISSELTALLDASDLKFSNVLSQSDFDSYAVPRTLCCFASKLDTTAKRYTFNTGGSWTGLVGGSSPTGLVYNDTGYIGTGGATNATNSIINMAGGSNTGLAISLTNNMSWAGVTDSYSLSLFVYVKNLDTNVYSGHFWHAGIVANVNTNFNYYSENFMTQSVFLIAGATSGAGKLDVFGRHYINNTSQLLLEQGDALYSIVCVESGPPVGTTLWATDFYVFHNNAGLGYPVIGKVRNMLLALDTNNVINEMGKLIRVNGGMSDGGSPYYIYVGNWGTGQTGVKKILMRCYSDSNNP
jgi:hypothetical protein